MAPSSPRFDIPTLQSAALERDETQRQATHAGDGGAAREWPRAAPVCPQVLGTSALCLACALSSLVACGERAGSTNSDASTSANDPTTGDPGPTTTVAPTANGSTPTSHSSGASPTSKLPPEPSTPVTSGPATGGAGGTTGPDGTNAAGGQPIRPGGTPQPATGTAGDPTGGGGFGGVEATAGGAGGEAPLGDGGSAPTVPEQVADWPLINGIQWADTEGNPIQAHGGGMLKVGDDYYWFGENRNPDGTFYAVSAYRSRDLKRWEFVHDVLTMMSDPGLDPANVERPKVVYNANTGKYVMWMHWENGMGYGEARAAVASSDTVDGDYTYHGSFRPMQDSGVMDHGKPGYMSRDCTLFVDDDGTGYFLSSSNENYDLHLYELTDDYLSIARRAALLFEGGHREAPALFKRGSTYFLVTSGATGWDPNQAKYATSASLVSGWSGLKDVADSTTFHSQSTYVQAVTGTDGTEYLYLGDRWAGAWGGRVNESMYVWQPISFPNDTTMSMSWFNDIAVDTTQGTVSGTVEAFTFINVASGMVMGVAGPADENSSDVVQQQQGSSSVWRLNYDGAGYFRITNQAGGKVIDVPDESTDAGTHVHLWDDNGGAHQAWRLIDLGRGRYRVRNKNSGLYLGVSGGSSVDGAGIEQQAQSDGDTQTWRVVVAR